MFTTYAAKRGLQRGVELGERRNRIGELCLQLSTALDRQSELVALGETLRVPA